MEKEQRIKYMDKAGDEKILLANLTENEHGFLSYTVDGETLRLHNVFGNGAYWNEFINYTAKENGCKIIQFGTRRNPDAWVRAYPEYKVVGYILEKEI